MTSRPRPAVGRGGKAQLQHFLPVGVNLPPAHVGFGGVPAFEGRAFHWLDKGRAWRVIHPLDADAMHDAAQRLVGRHDFTTFRSVHCQSESPLKSLDRLDVERDGDNVVIHAAARSFLHHQVRSMVGCLALVGQGRWSADDLQAALEACDRAALGLNAPPDGLYFVEATYPA